MTLEQLRIFVAVAEREHMTRAAGALNLTQSGVSAAISTLESQFSVPLFDRVGRRVVLTEAGHLLLEEAKAVLARVSEAEEAMSELEGLQRGVLRIYASQTIASYWLPKHIAEFRKLYPKVHVAAAIGNTAMVEKAVANGEAHIGFVEGETTHPGLHREVVAQDQLVFVVGRQHPWTGRAAVKPADLLELEWVMREVGSGTRSALESAMTSFGVSVNDMRISIELPSNEAVRSVVEEGLGVTALSYLVVEESIARSALYQLPLPKLDREFTLLKHKERRDPKTVEALLRLVRGY